MNEDGRKEEEIIYGSYIHKHRKLSLATGSSSASHLFSRLSCAGDGATALGRSLSEHHRAFVPSGGRLQQASAGLEATFSLFNYKRISRSLRLLAVTVHAPQSS